MDALMPHLPNIFLAWLAFFIGIVSPGPAILATIGTSMTAGRKAGVSMSLGIITISLFWGIVAALGLGSLLINYAYAITFIKIAGGIYLLWLAIKSIRSAAGQAVLTNKPTYKDIKSSKFFLQGMMIHITNPKAIFMWLATISIGINQSSPPSAYALIVFGGILISICVNLAYSVSFSTSSVTKFYNKFHRWFETAFGIMFAAAGIKLLLSAKQI